MQGHVETDRLGCLEIDHKFKLNRCLHWKLGWVLAFENAIHIHRRTPKIISPVNAARRFGARHAAACRSLKHPFRYCKAAVRRLNRLRAPKYPPVSPDQYLMHENAPTKPWMPGVENFSFLGPVGVMLSSCIMRCGRTFRLARTHPAHARSSGSETLSRSRSLAG